MLARLWTKGEEMSGYCPQWVYASCIGLASKDFLEKDIPIDLACKKYSKELSQKYDQVNPVEMASISEDIIRILAEVEAGEEADRQEIAREAARCRGCRDAKHPDGSDVRVGIRCTTTRTSAGCASGVCLHLEDTPPRTGGAEKLELGQLQLGMLSGESAVGSA